MKLNSNSTISFISGALLTLLFVFFFKPTFLTPKNNHNKTAANSEEIEVSTPSDASSKKHIKNPTGCDDACVLSVVDRLVSGDNLSNKLGSNIRNIEGKNVAAYLRDKPEITSKIEKTLESIKGQDARDSIIFVFSQLPIEQSVEIANRLTAQDNTKAQLDGLYLLQNSSKNGVEIREPLEEIITNNNDTKVVLQAISIMSKAYPTQFENASNARLNKIIANTENERDQGIALFTKVKLFKTDDRIKTDISIALNSKSTSLQRMAIQALGHVLYQQNKGRIPSDWRTDIPLNETLEAIANDKNGDRRNRAEILNLMVRYY